MTAIRRRESPPMRILPTRPILIFGTGRMTDSFSVQMEQSVTLTKPYVGRLRNHLQNASYILPRTICFHDRMQTIRYRIAPAPLTVEPEQSGSEWSAYD